MTNTDKLIVADYVIKSAARGDYLKKTLNTLINHAGTNSFSGVNARAAIRRVTNAHPVPGQTYESTASRVRSLGDMARQTSYPKSTFPILDSILAPFFGVPKIRRFTRRDLLQIFGRSGGAKSLSPGPDNVGYPAYPHDVRQFKQHKSILDHTPTKEEINYSKLGPNPIK